MDIRNRNTSTINISLPFTTEDEIVFWGREIGNNFLLISNGINDHAVKVANIRPTTIEDRKYTLREEALYYYNSWMRYIGSSETNDVRMLMLSSRNYFQRLLQILQPGTPWIGWISFSTVKQMSLQVEYVWGKITGSTPNDIYRYDNEFAYWTEHHVDQLQNLDKLLDPMEVELSRRIKEYVTQATSDLAMEDHDESFLDGYNQLINDMLIKQQDRKLVSTIMTTTLISALRIGQRADKIFQWFASTRKKR